MHDLTTLQTNDKTRVNRTQLLTSCVFLLQVPREVRDHRGAPRLRGAPGLRLDEGPHHWHEGVCGVSAVRHEEEAGSAVQGTRGVPSGDTLECHHGVRLPRQVEDAGKV